MESMPKSLCLPLDVDGKLIANDVNIYYTAPITNARLGYMPGGA